MTTAASTKKSISDFRLYSQKNYRKYFINITLEIMNHCLTPGYLLSTFKNYSDQVLNLSLLNSDEMTGYVRISKRIGDAIPKRHMLMVKLLMKYFDAESPIVIKVEPNTDLAEYSVEGFNKIGTYKGVYFNGSTVEFSIPMQQKKYFSHWIINGKRIESSTFRYNCSQNAAIEVFFKK